jgi:putative lipoprotein (rSAM/lipoprotein system)
MQINRRTFIKRINWALAGIIGMLGFGGCDKIGEEEPIICMYGSPHADYTVKGTVTNKATGKPIEGIRVGYSPEFGGVYMYGVIPTSFQPKKHVLTDEKGEFKLTDSFHSGEYQIIDNKQILTVYVEDIDGEENGLYQSEIVEVDFSKAEQTGKPDRWYNGEFTVNNVNVELTEIEKDSQSEFKDESDILHGKWKLISINSFTIEEGDMSFDYSQKNIIYEFKANNDLTVSGNIEDIDYKGHAIGKHFYEVTLTKIINNTLALPAPHTVKINTIPYGFSFGYMPDSPGMEMVCRGECNLAFYFVKR